MKKFVLLVLLMSPVAVYSAETEAPPTQTEEPKLYDHYLSLKRMQESMAGRSLEEQARLQPQIQRAEKQACERVRRERQERVPKEEYRQQGGDQFLVFAQQFEQYCETIQ
jgi:Ni/Co efflux regulator RcnB